MKTHAPAAHLVNADEPECPQSPEEIDLLKIKVMITSSEKNDIGCFSLQDTLDRCFDDDSWTDWKEKKKKFTKVGVERRMKKFAHALLYDDEYMITMMDENNKINGWKFNYVKFKKIFDQAKFDEENEKHIDGLFGNILDQIAMALKIGVKKTTKSKPKNDVLAKYDVTFYLDSDDPAVFNYFNRPLEIEKKVHFFVVRDIKHAQQLFRDTFLRTENKDRLEFALLCVLKRGVVYFSPERDDETDDDINDDISDAFEAALPRINGFFPDKLGFLVEATSPRTSGDMYLHIRYNGRESEPIFFELLCMLKSGKEIKKIRLYGSSLGFPTISSHLPSEKLRVLMEEEDFAVIEFDSITFTDESQLESLANGKAKRCFTNCTYNTGGRGGENNNKMFDSLLAFRCWDRNETATFAYKDLSKELLETLEKLGGEGRLKGLTIKLVGKIEVELMDLVNQIEQHVGAGSLERCTSL